MTATTHSKLLTDEEIHDERICFAFMDWEHTAFKCGARWAERALLARLGEQQPVLWQWRWKDTQGPWSDVTSSDELRDKAAFEYRALYAHPPAAQPADTSQALRARITEWRKLAQQFDAQRMSALWHLQALLGDPTGHAEAAGEFLAAKPAAQPVAQGERVALASVRAAVAGMYKDPSKGDEVYRCGRNGAVEQVLAIIDAEAARPAAQGAAQVPAGWQLVPVEPTAKMCKAAADAWLDCGSRMVLNKAGAAVRAGIKAAPSPAGERNEGDA